MRCERKIDREIGELLPFVLITRPMPVASDTADRLIELGYEVALSPVISYRDEVWPSQEILSTHEGLVVTSRYVIGQLPQYGVPYDTPLIVTGEVLGDLARLLGYQQVQYGEGNAETMLPLLRQHGDKQWLYLRGFPIAKDIVTLLRHEGVEIKEWQVYHTEPERMFVAGIDAMLRERPALVTLYSRHTARCFMRLVEAYTIPLAHHHAVCISNAIAETLLPEQWGSIHVANSPLFDDVESVLRSCLDTMKE